MMVMVMMMMMLMLGIIKDIVLRIILDGMRVAVYGRFLILIRRVNSLRQYRRGSFFHSLKIV